MSYQSGVRLACDGTIDGESCSRVNDWQPSLREARADARLAGWEVGIQDPAGGGRLDLCSVCVRSGQKVLA